MPIGAQGRWWNRNIPTKPFGIILGLFGLFFMAWLGYLYFGPALSTCVWSVAHRSTVTSQGLTFRVPWMWRQEERPAGLREISLVRARWGEPSSSEHIYITKDISPSRPPQKMMESLKTLASEIGQTDFRGAPFPLDPETALRYSCVAPHFDKLPDWQVSCTSNDHLWWVDFRARSSDVDDFVVILRRLASAQK
jgi:hypothetical protein